jgi:hypothetical protein
MKGAWLLHHKATGEDCVCSSLPVVFVIAPQLKRHSSRNYRAGNWEDESLRVLRAEMFRPEDVR